MDENDACICVNMDGLDVHVSVYIAGLKFALYLQILWANLIFETNIPWYPDACDDLWK